MVAKPAMDPMALLEAEAAAAPAAPAAPIAPADRADPMAQLEVAQDQPVVAVLDAMEQLEEPTAAAVEGESSAQGAAPAKVEVLRLPALTRERPPAGSRSSTSSDSGSPGPAARRLSEAAAKRKAAAEGRTAPAVPAEKPEEVDDPDDVEESEQEGEEYGPLERLLLRRGEILEGISIKSRALAR